LEKLKLEGFRHRFVLKDMAPGEHRLDILAVALGMIKGDWQIAGPMQTERKGIWGEVRINGRRIEGWQMRPGLVGERLRVMETPEVVEWTPPRARPCTWFHTTFELLAGWTGSDADFRLNASGLGKGMLFLNGRALARYCLIEAQGYGADRGWHKLEEDGLSLGPEGEPTQQYYHVPQSWMRPQNTLVLFEETDCGPDRVTLDARL
jgi:beta-galactosidase